MPKPHMKLRGALAAADIDPANRRVTMAVRSDSYIPRHILDDVAQNVCDLYGLVKMEITAVFPPDQLHCIEPAELMHMFVSADSMTRGSLAGARWDWEGETLTLFSCCQRKSCTGEMYPNGTQSAAGAV